MICPKCGTPTAKKDLGWMHPRVPEPQDSGYCYACDMIYYQWVLEGEAVIVTEARFCEVIDGLDLKFKTLPRVRRAALLIAPVN